MQRLLMYGFDVQLKLHNIFFISNHSLFKSELKTAEKTMDQYLIFYEERTIYFQNWSFLS